MLVDIRPDAPALETTTGVDFHPQDEAGGGNIAFYEILNTDDEIDISLVDYISTLDTPVAVFNTAFGPTDFDVIDQQTGGEVVSEQSGFDTDAWFINIADTSAELRITNFDTDAGVDGTQAAWYPYVTLLDLEA